MGISKEGFLFRAATLLNMLDENLRGETNLDKFKEESKNWVRKRIMIKPAPTLWLGPPSQSGRHRTGVTRTQTVNTIIDYFHPELVPSPQEQLRPATRQMFLEQYFPASGLHTNFLTSF